MLRAESLVGDAEQKQKENRESRKLAWMKSFIKFWAMSVQLQRQEKNREHSVSSSQCWKRLGLTKPDLSVIYGVAAYGVLLQGVGDFWSPQIYQAVSSVGLFVKYLNCPHFQKVREVLILQIIYILLLL